jgi:hypothetical protein
MSLVQTINYQYSLQIDTWNYILSHDTFWHLSYRNLWVLIKTKLKISIMHTNPDSNKDFHIILFQVSGELNYSRFYPEACKVNLFKLLKATKQRSQVKLDFNYCPFNAQGVLFTRNRNSSLPWLEFTFIGSNLRIFPSKLVVTGTGTLYYNIVFCFFFTKFCKTHFVNLYRLWYMNFSFQRRYSNWYLLFKTWVTIYNFCNHTNFLPELKLTGTGFTYISMYFPLTASLFVFMYLSNMGLNGYCIICLYCYLRLLLPEKVKWRGKIYAKM